MKSTSLLCFYAFIVQKSCDNGLLPPGCAWHFTHEQLTVTDIMICSLLSTSWNKFDTKMTKMKQNYMASVSGTDCQLIHYLLSTYPLSSVNLSIIFCQLIHYLPSKQGLLAINLPSPALKSKQCTCFFTPSADQCGFSILLTFGAITKDIINKIAHSLGTSKGGGVN